METRRRNYAREHHADWPAHAQGQARPARHAEGAEVLNAMPDASGRRDRRDVQIYERSGGRRAYRSPEPRHAPVWRHAGGSELIIVPRAAMTKSAQSLGLPSAAALRHSANPRHPVDDLFCLHSD